MTDYEAASEAASLWGRLMGGVLIALAFADVVAFIFEWREHRRWTRTAIAEIVALCLFVALGLGDWHHDSLQEERERLGAAKAKADAEELNASIEALQQGNAKLQADLGPFLKLAQEKYPNVDPRAALAGVAAEIEGLRQRADKQEARADALEHRAAPRSLTEEQAAIITSILKAHVPGPIVIMTVMGDGESKAFGSQIRAAFRNAGWAGDAGGEGGGYTQDPVGLQVVVHDVATVPPAANTIAEAFTKARLKWVGGPNEHVPAGSVEIRVGHKAAQ